MSQALPATNLIPAVLTNAKVYKDGVDQLGVATVDAPDFVIKAVSPEVTLSSYYVEATWTYESSSKIDVNSFQHTGYFYLVDNDGRIEIAEFYGED